MLLCLTATIYPKIKNDYNGCFDHFKRLNEYISNIFFLLRESNFTSIVLCDNSNYHDEIFSHITHFAKAIGKNFEYLTFEGDSNLIQNKGRGAGEQEILEYFYNHSLLLKKELGFYKLTGRYMVTNINEVVSKEENNQNIFFYMSPWHRRVSTAFFSVSKEFFEKNLIGCTKDINDSLGEKFQIEGIYTKKIQKNKKQIKSIRKIPIFFANTGSGYKLRPNIIRDGIKNLLHFLGFYSI